MTRKRRRRGPAARTQPVLLDTNILVRLCKEDDPQRPAAEEALRTLAGRGDRVCVVPQCAYEFHVVVTRPVLDNGLGLDPAAAVAAMDELLTRFHLLRDERGVFTRWRDLVLARPTRGRTSHDARLVAAMLRHRVPALLTFNAKHFRRFDGITVLDPATV